MSHQLQIYQYPGSKSNILDTEDNVTFGSNVLKPSLNLGFIHFLHRTKDKMEILYSDKFKGKYFYLVTNEFEHKIENYKKDLNTVALKSLNINKMIISRAFFKLWEILKIFNVANNKDGMNILHLAEAPGSFVQAAIYYRDKYSKKSNKDKHYVISINDKSKGVPSLHKLTKSLTKDHSKRVTIHGYTSSDNGDLTNEKILFNLQKKMNDKADLITADGGFNWTNENFQEQEAIRLILAEIIGAVMNQKEGGNFILKIFETFTESTIKLIEILNCFYTNIFIYKPYTSRSSNSEKYLVCEKFKKISETKRKEYIMKLLNIQKKINLQETINGLYVHDIFPDYKISVNIRNFFQILNTKLMIEQMKQINKIITYIKSENYFGDEYHQFKNNQIQAAQYWEEIFLKNRSISDLIVKQIKKNKSEINNQHNSYIN